MPANAPLTDAQVAALPPLSPNVACSLANIRDNIRFGRTSATLDLLRVVDELDSQRAQVAVLLAERDALKATIAKAYPYTEDPLYGQKRVAQLIAHYMGQADELAALLAERDALKRQVTFLKGELSQLANFNPDWDMLQATRESLQEHQARLREISYLLSDAGVGAGTLREGVISLRERSEAAEASLARVQSAAQTIVRGSDLRVLEATAHEPEARVAIATLDSERAMNAQLTAELEAAEAALSALRARETGLRELADAWRNEAERSYSGGGRVFLRSCANQLESAISTPAVHGASDTQGAT